jgi:hypothetical protein
MLDRELSGVPRTLCLHIWDIMNGKYCLCGDTNVRIAVHLKAVNANTIDVCCPVCLRALQTKAAA